MADSGLIFKSRLSTLIVEDSAREGRRPIAAGAQPVSDPASPAGLTAYYQARFWARVRRHEMRPTDEQVARTLVALPDVAAVLRWHAVRVRDVILKSALEQQHKSPPAAVMI